MMNKLILFVLVLGVLLRFVGVTVVSNTDEGVYIYMAKLVYDGVKPYQEFFCSQPPLYFILTSIVFRFFGVGLIQARFVPIFFSILTLPLIYIISSRLYNREHAFVTTIIFSISLGIITWTKIAVMYSELIFFGLLSSYIFLSGIKEGDGKRLFLSGILIGVSSLFRLSGILYLAAVLFFTVLKKRKIIYFGWVLSGFLLVFAPFIIYFNSQSFFYQIFTYHTIKPSYTLTEKIVVFFTAVLGAYPLTMVFGFIGLYLALTESRNDADFLYGILSVLGIFSVILLRYSYGYSNPVMYFLTVSYAFAMLAGKTIKLVGIKFCLIIGLILFFLWGVLPHVMYFACPYYRLLERDSSIKAVAGFILGETTESSRILGDPEVTPYVAFFSDRSLVDNNVDLSHYRFRIGELDYNYLKRASSNAEYVLASKNLGGEYSIFKDFLGEYCHVNAEFDVAYLYRCNNLTV